MRPGINPLAPSINVPTPVISYVINDLFFVENQVAENFPCPFTKDGLPKPVNN